MSKVKKSQPQSKLTTFFTETSEISENEGDDYESELERSVRLNDSGSDDDEDTLAHLQKSNSSVAQTETKLVKKKIKRSRMVLH